ncbi:MAG TPA: class I SAM-dependent methyltransferase [Cyclobacteriaceae bacterium]
MELGTLSRYIKYWLNAVEEHSLHSPYVYELYTQVIKSEYPDPEFERIEKIREALVNDNSIIKINDFGSGSKILHGNQRTISQIARTSISNPKLSKLLYRLIRQQEAKEVVELGTSLGINTLYMYLGNEQIRLTTFEGDENIAKYAEHSFKQFGSENIQLRTGELEKTLSQYLAFSSKIDFAFIDANHTFESTVRYFNKLAKKSHDESLFVIADIHWSSGMERAWNEIKKSPYVTLTIDVFEAGLVFFKPDITKQHYILEF